MGNTSQNNGVQGVDSPSTCSTVGDAYAESYDPKRQRVRCVPPLPLCPACYSKNTLGHVPSCPKFDVASAMIHLERARADEKRARERAEQWLMECRKMHGKLAMLKAELRKLRSRSNASAHATRTADGRPEDTPRN